MLVHSISCFISKFTFGHKRSSIPPNNSHDNFSSSSNSGGIFSTKSCHAKNAYFAMLVTGYGTENGKDFWTLKSSLGTNWGEKGYMRLARNAGNMCGIASIANYPFVQI